MPPRSRVPAWLPLLAVVVGVAAMVYTTVVVGMWILAGLALAEAMARGLGWEGATMRVRSRGFDATIFAAFAVALAVLASSGVLE